YPGEREVSCRGDEVRKVEGALPARLDEDPLMEGYVAGSRDDGDPRHYLALPLHQIEAPRLVDRDEVVREVRGGGALVRVRGEFVLAALHDVAGVGEREANATVRVTVGVPSPVIEVQVRVDDDRHILGAVPSRADPRLECGTV